MGPDYVVSKIFKAKVPGSCLQRRWTLLEFLGLLKCRLLDQLGFGNV